jgi:hypothetical protein
MQKQYEFSKMKGRKNPHAQRACRKHVFVNIKVKHIYEAELCPGSINYYFAKEFRILKCLQCGKVTDSKEVIWASKK